MSGHLQADQLKKIEDAQKKKLLQIEQNTIHDHLTKLQSWDLAEGQTLEERRAGHRESILQIHREASAAMQNAAQRRLTQANANAAAPGTPVQEQAPAKQTYKQRREQARKAKEARKHSPVGTADSYDIQQGISEVMQKRNNSVDNLVVPNDVDTKVLRSFCEGYKKNRHGRPATQEDQQAFNNDNDFLSAYISKDLERRKPYLERFRKELMDFPLSADTVSDAYIAKNAGRLKQILDRSCYYENIMKDPINKPYFDSLDPVDLDLLTTRMDSLNQIGGYFVYRTGSLGVDSNMGEYYNTTEAPTQYGQLVQMQREHATQMATGWEQQKREVLERHMEQEAAAAKQDILARIEVDLREQDEPLPEDMRFTPPAAGYATEELKRFRAMIETRPDVYAANKPLIDHLYQELYRGFDIFNGLALDSSAYQYVSDARRTANGIQDPVFYLAEQKVESILKAQDAVRYRIGDFGDALQFYFKESPLSDHAKKLLLELGQDEATLTLMDRQHKVHKIFLGDDGMVAKSNQALKDANESGKPPVEARSSALQALGIRVSTTPAAKANHELRKDTYTNLLQDIAQKFHDIEGQGTDLTAIQQQMEKKRVLQSQNGYVTGGGVDAVNENLLALYGTYLNSDESVQYLKFMCETLKNAEVFSGDSRETLSFLSQSLLNSFGSNYSVVASTQKTYQNGEAAREVAMESCRTLLSLTAMTRLSDEERAQLPEATQRLTAQYITLLNQVHQKIYPPAPQQ